MLPPPLSEFERRLGQPVGSLTGVDAARAGGALEDASALILDEAADVSPAIAAAWATSAPSAMIVIALKAARREWDNPEGLTTAGSPDMQAGLSTASGVFLMPDEVAKVRRAAARGVGRRRTTTVVLRSNFTEGAS